MNLSEEIVSYDEQMTSPSQYVNISSLFERWNYMIIASIFSGSIATILLSIGHSMEIFLLVLEVFILWVLIDLIARKILPHIQSIKENHLFYELILGVLDFVSQVLVYLLFILLFSMVTIEIDNGELNISESFVVIFTIGIISISLYHSAKLVFNKMATV